MFSVIIPLYNKASHIHKSIYSVVNQTYKDFEIIVINDGSTDNSLEIVQQIKQPNLFVIDRENKGVAYTRNQGVALSKRKYVAFLDADDWWAPNYLEEMSKLIEKYPDQVLYSSNFVKIENHKEKKFLVKIPENYQGKINYFQTFFQVGDSPIWTSATILDKNSFESVGGFNINLKGGEDLMLWINLVIKFDSFIFNNKYLVYYNYDVDLQNRAIYKVFPKENYFLFYLDIFKTYEEKNEELKKLLDFIRINFSKVYYRNSLYIQQIKTILYEVDKKNFTLKDKLFYSFSPKALKFIYKTIKRDKFIFKV